MLVTVAVSVVAQPTLRVVTSDLPPLAYEHSRSRPGALHELTEELMQRAGYGARIEYVPWKRAVFLTDHLARVAIFPLTRTAEREPKYRWLAQLYREQFVLLAESSAADTLNPDLYKTRRIALLRGSAQENDLLRRGYTNVIPTASVAEGLRFLHHGIVDALYGDSSITLAIAHHLYPRQEYAISVPLATTSTWLGGSLDLSNAEAELFSQLIKDMHTDGTYSRILQKYHLMP